MGSKKIEGASYFGYMPSRLWCQKLGISCFSTPPLERRVVWCKLIVGSIPRMRGQVILPNLRNSLRSITHDLNHQPPPSPRKGSQTPGH